MKRRELLLVLGAALGVPRTLCAEQKAMPVIGFLGGFAPSMNAQIELEQAAFRRGLSETGFVERQNVTIVYGRGRATSIACPHWPPTSSPAKST
jgi:putative ABC transport system substrate-binding protein